MGIHSRKGTTRRWTVGGCCEKYQETPILHTVGGTVILTFEEMTTVSQIEDSLNSQPLTSLPCNDDGVLQALTPGHFLIGRPLEALPNPDIDTQPLTV